jgi:hypothetical protein
MHLSYCHQKLSLAVFEMCLSTQSLKNRLRGSLKHSFTAFPEDTFPKGTRQRFSEIRNALAGVRLAYDFRNRPDAIDRMKPSQVRRLIGEIICLREAVAKEYHRLAFTRPKESNTQTMEEFVKQIAQLLGR